MVHACGRGAAAWQLPLRRDQAGHLLGEYDKSGAALREYIWLDDVPVALFTPGATASAAPVLYYIHTDHLNTPRAVVDTAGNLRWRWIADPFGTAVPETNPAGLGNFVQNLRMPGQYADSETGLFYNMARYYDPMIGRYVESDPIGLAGGINTYAYVGGNPITYTDPRGLDNPGMGPYGPGPNRGDGSMTVTQVVGAMTDFRRNYQDMRQANTIGGDKYFHCMANCQATKRGPAGEVTACVISDAREYTDQKFKGDPASASLADHAANAIGRSGAMSLSSESCNSVCGGFRPNGLPDRY